MIYDLDIDCRKRGVNLGHPLRQGTIPDNTGLDREYPQDLTACYNRLVSNYHKVLATKALPVYLDIEIFKQLSVLQNFMEDYHVAEETPQTSLNLRKD